MPIDHVPHAHIEHWLAAALKKRKVKEAEHEAWLKKAKKPGLDGPTEVRQYIEQVFPGTLAILRETWPFKSPHALVLWRLPCLAEETPASATQLHASSRGKMGKWAEVKPKASPEGAKVRKLLTTATTVEAVVWLTKQVSRTYEGEEQTIPSTVEVSLRINFAGDKVPVCEVYATPSDARHAVFALLDWLRGTPTPRRVSKEQTAVLQPVQFSEPLIVGLAERLEWGDPRAFVGIDVTGRNGEFSVTGRKAGSVVGPLDTTDARIQKQLDRLANAARRYATPFTHDDGYVEEPQVKFHFKGTHQRLQFLTHTSLPAAAALILEVRKELRV